MPGKDNSSGKKEPDVSLGFELHKKLFAGPDSKLSPDFGTFIAEFFAHGIIGLVLGAAVDRVGGLLADYVISRSQLTNSDEDDSDDKGDITIKGRLILFGLGSAQLLIDLLLLYALTLVLPTYVYKRWQGTIPGLAFPALFFGIQSNMFYNIRAIME